MEVTRRDFLAAGAAVIVLPLITCGSERGGEGRVNMFFKFIEQAEDWGVFCLMLIAPRPSHYTEELNAMLAFSGEGTLILKSPSKTEWIPEPHSELGAFKVTFTLEAKDVAKILGRDMGYSVFATHSKTKERCSLSNGMILLEADSISMIGAGSSPEVKRENKN